jgi:hypothetical protein
MPCAIAAAKDAQAATQATYNLTRVMNIVGIKPLRRAAKYYSVLFAPVVI